VSTGSEAATAEIGALREALGASTDLELAAMLGLSRSTISTWKRRGGVPSAYIALVAANTVGSENAAAQQRVFRRPEARYWLRTALALLPGDGANSGNILESGRARERLVIGLMGLAIRVARTDLKRQTIRDDAEWASLMERLVSVHRDAVVGILRDNGAAPSADVLNGVLNRED
jgi:transcriptional regulator with XRE-family HTH domain